MGTVNESEPCDQLTVSEGKPLELLQERSDTYPGSAPIPADMNLAALRWTPKPVDLTHLVLVPDCTTIL